MSLPIQTIKKIGIFIGLGLLPLIMFLLFLLLGLDLLASSIIGIFTALFMVVIAHKITDTPFLRAFEGKTFGVLTIDSRGKIDFFDVSMIDSSFVGEYNGTKIRVPFNQAFIFRIRNLLGKGKLKQVEEKIEIELTKTDYSNSLFKTEFPILIWDRQLNCFITKEWLHYQEKKDMLLALGFETSKHIKDYNKNASGITRMIVDMIGAKLNKQSWLIWIIILIIAIVAIWQFYPQLQAVLGGTIADTSNTISGISLPDKLGG